MVEAELRRRNVSVGNGPAVGKVVALLKERASSALQLADEAMLFYSYEDPGPQPLEKKVLEALRMLKVGLTSAAWQRSDINAAIKEAVKSSGLKMPQLAMPLRLLVTGRTQTPSIDAGLELLRRQTLPAPLSHPSHSPSPRIS